MSGPPFLGGGLILIIRTSHSRIKEKCKMIESEHNGGSKTYCGLGASGLPTIGCLLAGF